LWVRPEAYPRVGDVKGVYSERLRPYQQTLDKAEKIVTDKNSSLLREFINHGHTVFITLVPGVKVKNLFFFVTDKEAN
jgi:hypothetical protein